MAMPWFVPNAEGELNPTRHHPRPRFLPNSTAATFRSGGEIFLVEVYGLQYAIDFDKRSLVKTAGILTPR
jgi:hypothetical protein